MCFLAPLAYHQKGAWPGTDSNRRPFLWPAMVPVLRGRVPHPTGPAGTCCSASRDLDPRELGLWFNNLCIAHLVNVAVGP